MSHTIVSIRMDNQHLARLDQNAQNAGMNRTQYILSWLPECYDEPPSQHTQNDTSSTQPEHRGS